MSATRIPHTPVLLAGRVIAVLRAEHASEYPSVIDSLIRGGVTSIELTLSTRGVFEQLPALVAHVGAVGEVGVGTVTTRGQAETAIAAGAAFIVTPVMSLDVIDVCTEAGVPVYPGGLTPTEIHQGWVRGASAVKVFPAATVGAGYVSQLRGPFPDLEVIPSGGVDAIAAVEWMRAGAVAVSVGGPLLGDAFAGGAPAALVERAHRLSETIKEVVAGRSAR